MGGFLAFVPMMLNWYSLSPGHGFQFWAEAIGVVHTRAATIVKPMRLKLFRIELSQVIVLPSESVLLPTSPAPPIEQIPHHFGRSLDENIPLIRNGIDLTDGLWPRSIVLFCSLSGETLLTA